MKKLVMVMGLALVSALLVPAARAQMGGPDGMQSSRIVSFGLGGGVSLPVSDAKDAFKNGFNGHGFVRFNLHQLPIAPRIDFTFSKFDVASAKLQAAGGTAGASGTSQMLGGLASLQYFLIPGGPLRPYVVAGVGAYNIKTDVSGITNAGAKSDMRFGVNGGGGVLLKLGSMVSAYVEGHLDNVFSQKGGFLNASQIQVVPVTFGIVF